MLKVNFGSVLQCTKTVIVLVAIQSNIALAALPDSVNRAMSQASLCKQSQQGPVYISCMQDNNTQIRKDLVSLRDKKLESFGYSKKQTIKKNVDAQINKKLKHCLNEKARYQDLNQAHVLDEFGAEVAVYNIGQNPGDFAKWPKINN